MSASKSQFTSPRSTFRFKVRTASWALRLGRKPETVVGVLLRSFDGDGNFEQVDNIKGSVTGIVPDRISTGTYEVFPDCSGVTEFQPDPNNPNLVIRERFVILDNGNEIRSMAEAPAPLMVTTVGKRVLKR